MERLDKYLSDTYHYPRSSIQRAIKLGKVSVEGKVCFRPSQKVHADMQIIMEQMEEGNADEILQPSLIPLEVVYEDKHLLAINKQAGLSVHPGAGNVTNTLVNGLIYRYPWIQNIGGLNRAGLIHRLDKETTGMLLIAKDEHTFFDITYQFKERKVQKEYIALLKGQIPEQVIHIENMIGRNPKNRFKRAVMTDGKVAVTDIHLISYCNNDSLVRMLPKTGRTHQLRVHAQYIHHAIVGDSLYLSEKETGPLFLHARSIRVLYKGQEFYLKADFPLFWKHVLDNVQQPV